jgi:BMFP domain-containing protein YqiC
MSDRDELRTENAALRARVAALEAERDGALEAVSLIDTQPETAKAFYRWALSRLDRNRWVGVHAYDAVRIEYEELRARVAELEAERDEYGQAAMAVAQDLRRAEEAHAEETRRLREACEHVAGEITGQLEYGVLRKASYVDKLYWSQLCLVLRNPDELVSLASSPAAPQEPEDDAVLAVKPKPGGTVNVRLVNQGRGKPLPMEPERPAEGQTHV